MQADDIAISVPQEGTVVPLSEHETAPEPEPSTAEAALSPSPSAAMSGGSSTEPRRRSLMEQARVEKVHDEQARQIRERRAARQAAASTKQGGKQKKPIWSSGGPKKDEQFGGELGFGNYPRPFTDMRQAWSDAEREPGFRPSMPYAFYCVYAGVLFLPGDVVATTLRACHFPEAGAFWIGRLTSVSFAPLTIPLGGLTGAVTFPAVAYVIAKKNRDRDNIRIEFEKSRSAGKIIALYPTRDAKGRVKGGRIIPAFTGTETQGAAGLPSDISVGAMSFD